MSGLRHARTHIGHARPTPCHWAFARLLMVVLGNGHREEGNLTKVIDQDTRRADGVRRCWEDNVGCVDGSRKGRGDHQLHAPQPTRRLSIRHGGGQCDRCSQFVSLPKKKKSQDLLMQTAFSFVYR